jgi:hypothetical protein
MSVTNSQHLNEEQLSSLVDQRLEPAEQASARAHLATCAGCRADYENLRATVGLLRGLPDLDPPRSFKLPEKVTPLRPARGSLALKLVPWTRAAGALAAALFVVLVSAETLSGLGQAPAALKAAAPAKPAAQAPAAAPAQDRQAEAAKPASPQQQPAPAQEAPQASAPNEAHSPAAPSSLRAPAPTMPPVVPTTAATPPPASATAQRNETVLRPWQVVTGLMAIILLLLSIVFSRTARTQRSP